MKFIPAVTAILMLFQTGIFAQERSPDVIILGDSTLAITNQDVTLSGVITEKDTGNPLHGATIFAEEVELGTSSDADGYYSLTLPPGEYTLRFQYLGMQTVYQQVVLYSSDQLDIEMERRDLDFDEIIVEGTGFWDNIRGTVTGVEVTTIRDLEQLPQLMGEIDVVQSLVALPGVQTVGEGSSGFNVRGGREDQNLVLMDGAPLFNSSHVLGLFSVFNPDVTESYALYKGHMPARFGGRLSSVLDVSMRNGSFEEFKVRGGIGLYSGRLMAEGPIKKDRTSFLVSGRGAASGILFSMAGKNRDLVRLSLDSDIYNSSAWFYDGNATISHRFSNHHILSLSLYGSNDFFRFSDEFGFSWENRIANLKLRSAFSDNFFSEFSAVVNSYNSTSFTPTGPDAFLLETGIDYLKLQQNFLYTGLQNHTIQFGAEWNRYNSNDETIEPYNDFSAIGFDIVEKDEGDELAFYIGDEFEITPDIAISLGTRYTIYNQRGPSAVFSYEDGRPRTVSSITDTTHFSSGEKIVTYQGFEPRLSSRFSITANSSIKLSYNRTRQYLHQISNSTSPTPADIWQVSTRFLPPQKAHNYSAGYYHNFDNDNWETSAEFYYRDIENLVEYIDFAELFLNNHLETELFSGRGRAYGGEFTIRKNHGNWTGWLSYTYGRSFVKASSEFPGIEINRGDWFPSNYDQPHNLNLTAIRSISDNSAFSFNFTWRTGRPITALSASYLDENTTVPVYSDRNKYRIPDYIRLDISFTIADNIWKNRTVDPDRRMNDSANFTLYNVLSRKNAFSVFYRRPLEASVPRANKLSVLGAVIPAFTYNFNF